MVTTVSKAKSKSTTTCSSKKVLGGTYHVPSPAALLFKEEEYESVYNGLRPCITDFEILDEMYQHILFSSF